MHSELDFRPVQIIHIIGTYLTKKPNLEGHPKEQYIQDFAKQWTAKKKPWLFAHVTCLKLNFTHLPSHDLWVQIRGWVCNILGPGNNGYISPNVSFHSHFAIFPPTWVGYSLLWLVHGQSSYRTFTFEITNYTLLHFHTFCLKCMMLK